MINYINRKNGILLFCLLLFFTFGFAAGQTTSSMTRGAPSRGEAVMKAIAAAYPGRVGPAEYRNGDWAVSIRGVYYYYADGRLLPESLRSRYAEFASHSFYNNYPENLPAWRAPTAEEAARFQERSQNQNQNANRPRRSPHFFDALWQATNRDESYERLRTVNFLGQSIRIHHAIVNQLSSVEETIRTASRTNTDVRQWMQNIRSITTWNWRNIAGSGNRSFHAYGIAVDILPRNSNQEMYWQWTSQRNAQWWNVPYSRRHHPPAAVIRAFESYGFVWGGKWTYYDTIHFEYRPEVFILNNIPLRSSR